MLLEVAKVGGRACAVIRESGCVKVLCSLMNCNDVELIETAAETLSFCTLSGESAGPTPYSV